MKLKYNQSSVTETIPLSTRKKQGKRLAIHHNGQNFYAPVVPTNDPKASNLPVGVNGEIFAVQAQEPPEVTAVNVAPSSVAVMQGQSATATVSAVGNDAVTGLSYGLSGAPTWITISDDLILIQPSDNDLGIANVQVYAQDTGSDAMSAAILRAEAKLRPIIQSLSVVPPAVTVQQGQSAIATVSAVANEAVTGLSYSLNGASSWLTLTDNSIIVAPTDNDLGSNTVDVIAYDTNSSASAATQFVATAALRPIISSVSVNPPTVAAAQGESTTATISAVANAAVTGLSYSLEGQPSWMNLSGSVILMTPTENDSGSAAVTVTAQDTGSTAHAETVFNAEAMEVAKITDIIVEQGKPNIRWNDSINSSSAKLTAVYNNKVNGVRWEGVSLPSWVQLSYGANGTAEIKLNKQALDKTLIGEHPVSVKATSLDDASISFVKEVVATVLPAWTYININPNHYTILSGSGTDTINTTISTQSDVPITLTGYVPRGATVSTNVTKTEMTSPARTMTTVDLSIKYLKSKQTLTSGERILLFAKQDANEYFTNGSYDLYMHNLRMADSDAVTITIPAAT